MKLPGIGGLMNRMDLSALRGLSATLLVTLAACGGGGGSDQGSGHPNPPPAGATSVLAGGWSGSGAPGESVQLFVIADGTAWTFAMNASNAPLDMFVGALALSNGQLSSTGMRAFDYDTRTAVGAVASGTYVVGSQMAFTITPDGATVGMPIAVNAVPATDYDPARPAALADIAGAWGGAFTSDETGVVAISPTGIIQNFTTSTGCSGLGSVAPRANENVFDVSLTLGPAPCAAPDATATGTGFVVGNGAAARLYVGVKTADGSQGATFIGGRP
jgi:hypothetical protein